MTDVLDKIDASLEEVEEQLLKEFDRVRNTVSADRYAQIDPGIRNALEEVIDVLKVELEHSGEGQALSLITERHEVLYSRIAVLKHLVISPIRTAYLEEAHEGIDKRRQQLETRVIAQRNKQDPSITRQTEERKGGLVGSLRGLFDHKPSDQHLARNAIKVTATEEKELQQTQVYLDNGIYSASRELGMIASLNRGGSLDRPPEARNDAAEARGRAIFESKDLSHKPPPEVDGRKEPQPKPEPVISKREIAQTPEEIRRKLESRSGQGAGGKASFAARDLSSHTENPTPTPQPEPKTPAAPEPPPAGKAVFASRDIDPVAPSDPPRRRGKQEEEEEEKPPERRSGPAVFESRDLSKTPFPKKD